MDYIVVYDWMINNSKLHGRHELMMYALVYACTRNGEGTFYAKESYAANRLGISTEKAKKILNQLADKGFLLRVENVSETGYWIEYKIIKDAAIKIHEASKEFKKPTVEEVRAYFERRGCDTIDPEYFINYNEDRNWIDSRNRKIHNWKRAAANWVRKEINIQKTQTVYHQRVFD